MAAPGVVSVMVTCCGPVKVPVAGEMEGVAGVVGWVLLVVPDDPPHPVIMVTVITTAVTLGASR
jgi:hypothetical protein